MQIIKAEVLGMCFGVRDALRIMDGIAEPERVTIHGELVHNETVIEQLAQRGFQMIQETARRPLPLTDTVLVTAHGISHKERRRLQDAGKELVDTTCPLVERAHQAAQKLQQEGRHVLVIGKRGHVEIQGVIEDLDSFDVIQNASEVRQYPFAKLGIMCQTTTPARLVQQIRAAVAEHNPDADIRFIDTVCHPTKDHQRALEALLEQVEAVVVVGGRNSNNTRELVARCREHGLAAYHIQSADDLEPQWFEGLEVVGLTAGTSTLDATIDEVHQALVAMGSARMPVLV
ncbi:MAG TPA: 4-hydroxy-3-methylbut-2-enyl diphosphate reductase [Gemmataceae bacterium]|nr:4-hydroxy-3-methylbut-2-enyl diphosphate reductase [Gemmataceae bacterium]